MADFCVECSKEIFQKDFGDLKGLCKEDEIIYVICEGCGFISVDCEGKRVGEKEKKDG